PEGGPRFDTYIGHCVNVAARAEGVSKTLYEGNTIVADTTIELVSERLFGRTFAELRRRERDCASDGERVAIHEELERQNHELCLSYIDQHILKGVATPMPLYRLARSAAELGNPRFDALLRGLAPDAAHLAEVRAFLGAGQ